MHNSYGAAFDRYYIPTVFFYLKIQYTERNSHYEVINNGLYAHKTKSVGCPGILDNVLNAYCGNDVAILINTAATI